MTGLYSKWLENSNMMTTNQLISHLHQGRVRVEGQVHSEIPLPRVCPVAMTTRPNRICHIMRRGHSWVFCFVFFLPFHFSLFTWFWCQRNRRLMWPTPGYSELLAVFSVTGSWSCTLSFYCLFFYDFNGSNCA